MKKLSDIFSAEKSKLLVILLLATGLVLFFLSGNTGSNGNREVAEYTPTDELAQYSELLERNLEDAVSKLTGDQNAKVMITLESTFENVYASDASINEAVTADKTDRRSEKQLVLTGGTASQSPVTVKRIPPKIKGAVIVCKNGEDGKTRSEITALAMAALNISESKIYVTGGN